MDRYNSMAVSAVLPEYASLLKRDQVDPTYRDEIPESITGRRIVCNNGRPMGFITGNGKRVYVTLGSDEGPKTRKGVRGDKLSNILRSKHMVSTVVHVSEWAV